MQRYRAKYRFREDIFVSHLPDMEERGQYNETTWARKGGGEHIRVGERGGGVLTS